MPFVVVVILLLTMDQRALRGLETGGLCVAWSLSFSRCVSRSLHASCESMRPFLTDLAFVVWRHGTFCADLLWLLLRVLPVVLSIFVLMRLGNLGS